MILKPSEMGFNIKPEFWRYSSEFNIMPKVNLNDKDASAQIDKYISEGYPVAIEFVFNKDPGASLTVLSKKIKVMVPASGSTLSGHNYVVNMTMKKPSKTKKHINGTSIMTLI